MIDNVPLFQGNDSGFIASLLLSFKIEVRLPWLLLSFNSPNFLCNAQVYPPYEYVIRVGTIGREMYIVIKGEVDVLVHRRKVKVISLAPKP